MTILPNKDENQKYQKKYFSSKVYSISSIWLNIT